MQVVANKLAPKFSGRFAFSGSKMLWQGSEAPVKHRVMSTPTWPAPYYQRIFKAYPVRNRDRSSLLLADIIADDTNWYSAKELLRETVKGREIVEFTEQHVKTNSNKHRNSAYLILQNDTANMVEGYVNDIVQFMNIANKENTRILSGSTLI